MPTLEGQTFAGYEIISKLGQGGMGAVWKARQPLLNRFAAVKIMAPELAADPEFVKRFKREATAAASLTHENLVQVYGAGEFEGQHYIAMEFVEGETLRNLIERSGRLEPAEALAITIQVAQALQYGWNKARLIHRDIKPENIFLTPQKEVRVGDMGLAKTVGGPTTSLTQTGITMGSPHYISPEQARGLKEIDFRADIYSLGCTLFHMLTGRPPYEADDALALIAKHVNDPPPAIFKVWPTCPLSLGMLVGKMLAKKPHERPGSYEELIAQLRQVREKLGRSESPEPAVGSRPVAAAAAAPRVATPKPVKARLAIRDWRLVVGGAAVVMAG
ncbi:MAG: serine/threonine protein kinase, partial [Verrucomicrobiae bacterium]|nr:serine/threonine protein kinase [Verrucomicrobiae bacterium]